MTDPRHPCPGCGLRVPNHLFACRLCWHRLPYRLRQAITSTWRRRDHTGHRRAMAEAIGWYAAHRHE